MFSMVFLFTVGFASSSFTSSVQSYVENREKNQGRSQGLKVNQVLRAKYYKLFYYLKD